MDMITDLPPITLENETIIDVVMVVHQEKPFGPKAL